MPKFNGVSIKTMPKTEYKVGDYLSIEGGVLLLHYDDGSTREVVLDYYHIEGFSSKEPGTYTLTVKYVEDGFLATCTYEITVTEANVIKAGTYRFNDVLIVPSANLAQKVSFKATDIVIVTEELATEVNTYFADAIAEGLYEALTQGSYTVNYECYEINLAEWTSAETFNKSYQMSYQCNSSSITVEPHSDLLIAAMNPFNSQDIGVPVFDEEDGWKSGSLKTITITKDTAVSKEFSEWFTNNANKILEIKMKDLFFNYNESQAQVGYKSAVLYKKQGDTKYRFLCASESVPFPYGTKDTFEYDLLNSSSKGLAEGKNILEQKEVELLYTPNNAYLFEQLKGQVLDFMSLTPDKIGYKYHGTISFRPNDATADIHRGTYTITPMGASEVPYFMARKECYVPLFFADVIPYEISIAELGDADSVALNLGLVGNYKEAVYKYDTFSETTNRFSGTSNDITVTNGIGTIPKNAGLYLITAEPKETDKTTHSGCFTLVYITD